MAKLSKHQQPSQETQDEAMKIAKRIQKPGQTKTQTKLIAQGIQKGIAHYKKQHKEKTRQWDKQHKKTSQAHISADAQSATSEQVVRYQQHWLPWLLLVLSWLGFAAFLFFTSTGE